MQKFFLFSLFLLVTINAWANETYNFNCKDSSIRGHIKYSMVLDYDFSFAHCRGIISYNPIKKEISAVDVLVLLKSIQSNCPLCNRIVLSKRILHESLFPYIHYHADNFTKINGLYKVSGQMHVHGISRTLGSYFSFIPIKGNSLPDKLGTGPQRLLIKGSWIIPRKDYDIIWSKYLDHGGVVVSDTFTINWQVIAHKITK